MSSTQAHTLYLCIASFASILWIGWAASLLDTIDGYHKSSYFKAWLCLIRVNLAIHSEVQATARARGGQNYLYFPLCILPPPKQCLFASYTSCIWSSHCRLFPLLILMLLVYFSSFSCSCTCIAVPLISPIRPRCMALCLHIPVWPHQRLLWQHCDDVRTKVSAYRIVSVSKLFV